MTTRAAAEVRHDTGALVRAIAAGIDALAALGLAVLLSKTSGVYFAKRTVETFRIGQTDSIWKGPVPMLLGAVSTVAYGAAFALLLVWFMEAAFGTSPGKLVMRREIVVLAGNHRGALWKRFTVKSSGAWLFCAALVLGSWQLVVVAALAGLVVMLGFLPVAAGRRALHDRVCATAVVERLH